MIFCHDAFDVDLLDPDEWAKAGRSPEEIVPLRIEGRIVLDRNPDNSFAETEQVAFCTRNIVPGLDFSDDPLAQRAKFFQSR